MDATVNIEQAAAWNGYEGNHWAENQSRYDAVNSGFNDHLLAAAGVAERDRVLDIGCGNGQVTRLAARRARHGSAVGIDLSAPMLRRARASAAEEGVGNVTFQQGDAQVYPFPAAGFDVAVSRFGIMFFADPVVAFANIARALRPAGRLAILSLADPGGTDLGAVLAALGEHLPRPPATAPDPAGPDPAGSEAAGSGAAGSGAAGSDDAGSGAAGPDAAGPLSLADPAVVRTVLTSAGFERVTATAVEAVGVWGRDTEDAARFLGDWGPVRFTLARVDEGTATRARAALTAALRPYEGPAGVRLRSVGRLITAVRSGDRPE